MSRRLIAFNGSPRRGGNTDRLTDSLLDGAAAVGCDTEQVYLNDLAITPCQSCGRSPGEKLCFYEDSLFPFLHRLAASDVVVIATPVYFDTVTAQTKLLIDRCNCFKPLEGYERGEFRFVRLPMKPRLGVIILVGGEREKFDCALKVVRGFFIWTGITYFDQIVYAHADYGLGAVSANEPFLSQARALGVRVGRAPIR